MAYLGQRDASPDPDIVVIFPSDMSGKFRRTRPWFRSLLLLGKYCQPKEMTMQAVYTDVMSLNKMEKGYMWLVVSRGQNLIA